MLTITYTPDGALDWSAGLVLCNTSRSITELDVKFNHRRSLSVEQLATVLGSGSTALAQDFANWRNTLSLKVRRSVDFTTLAGMAFPDPEGALAFALSQPAQFPTTGTLRLQLVGVTTNITLYLLNCAVEGISLADWLGNAPAFDYTFNGGLITTASPF
jgi:hypothetical protein